MASEIKANKISPATGTAFTIGDSGDTFTVPSGATLNVASGGTISNSGTASGLGGGKVLQCLTVQKVDAFSTSSTSYVDVTDITLDITPSATTSRIMVMLMSRLSPSANGYPIWAQMLRDSTVIGSGSGSTGEDCFASGYPWSDGERQGHSSDFNWLDSPTIPSSPIAITYKMQVRMYGVGAGYVGRSSYSASIYSGEYSTSLTLMEIGA
jgi:hypothetical protein